jgi:hypothetical protein
MNNVMAKIFFYQWRGAGTAAALLGCMLLAAGCTSLKEVSSFALASQATMDKAAAFDGYGRFDYCYDSVIVFNDTSRELRGFECNCGHGTAADTMQQHAYRIMSGYFAALAKLADSKTVIKTTTLGGAVSAGTFGSVTISSTEAGIFNGLMTAAQDVLTDHYKSKKIEDLLTTYHDTVNRAIQSLMNLTQISAGLLQGMSTKFRENINILVNSAKTPAERLALVALYKDKALEWARVAADDERRYQALKTIQEGHDSLFAGIKNLKSDALKKQVLDFAGNIIYLSQ